MANFNTTFYGNEISAYGREHGFVDYRTFSKAFNHVLNNDIYELGHSIGNGWECVSTGLDNSEEIEAIEMELERLEACGDAISEAQNELAPHYAFEENIDSTLFQVLGQLNERINELTERKEALEEAQDFANREVFQWYIIDDLGAEICEEFGEIVYYHEELGVYLWGVTHWGTGWDYVLTDIACVKSEEAEA